MTAVGARPSTCPSSTCTPGNLLIGIVRHDGTVVPLRTPLSVDERFAERASAEKRPPETRFRFAGPCVESGCENWSGGRCGVADVAVAEIPASDHTALRPCAIRATCRWWTQHGPAACRRCAYVIHTPA